MRSHFKCLNLKPHDNNNCRFFIKNTFIYNHSEVFDVSFNFIANEEEYALVMGVTKVKYNKIPLIMYLENENSDWKIHGRNCSKSVGALSIYMKLQLNHGTCR